MKLTKIFEKDTLSLSFEVFPPKVDTAFESVKHATEEIAKLRPSFMSVTYGAGGGTSEYTLEIAKNIKKQYNVPTLAHLTCVSSTVETVENKIEEIKAAGMEAYFVDHTAGVYPQAAAGFPFDALSFAVKGDVITDLHEDMAAEQKARTTYDNIIRMVDDPDVLDPIRYLREREIVHFQRFGETLENVKDRLNSKNFYAINPSFDK